MCLHTMHPQIRSFFLGALRGAPLSLPSLELLTLRLEEAADGRRPAFTFGVPLETEMGGEGVCSALATLVAQGVLPALKQARPSAFWGCPQPDGDFLDCRIPQGTIYLAVCAAAVCLLRKRSVCSRSSLPCCCCMHVW